MKLGAAWLVIIGALVVSCGTVNKYIGVGDDHEAEEISEAVIESYTGLDVDLTPHSPEGTHEENERPGQHCDCNCVTRDDS